MGGSNPTQISSSGEPNSALATQGEGEIEVDRETRWGLVRQALVFQFKLALDGLKDLVLSPLVLGALAVDLLKPRVEPGHNMHRVFRGGRAFDEWLDLFSAARERGEPQAEGSLDEAIDRLERLVRSQAQEGELGDKVKGRIDELVGALREGSS